MKYIPALRSRPPIPNLQPPTPNFWLAGIIIAGLALRLWFWWRVPFHQPANDEVEYLQVANDLLTGRGWTFYEHYHWLRAPLYPIFLAGSLLLAGGDLRWAALPNIVLSTATIGLFYVLGKTVATDDERNAPPTATHIKHTGLIAAAFAAVLLPFATFASLWMSETLFTALFTGALIALLRWGRNPRLGWAALAGILLGLATLTRSMPLAALPLLGVWMIAIRRPGLSLRTFFVGTAFCIVVTLATIAPWTMRNWRAYGGFIPVETGLSYNLWVFNDPHETRDTIHETLESIENPALRAEYATDKGLARLREDPAILLRNMLPNWFLPLACQADRGSFSSGQLLRRCAPGTLRPGTGLRRWAVPADPGECHCCPRSSRQESTKKACSWGGSSIWSPSRW